MPTSEAKKQREKERYRSNPEPKRQKAREYRMRKKLVRQQTATQATTQPERPKRTRRSSALHLVDTAMTELPAAELPAAELPAAELPAAELPAAELPAAELPVTELPVTELPVTELPAAELPAAELPVEETLFNEARTLACKQTGDESIPHLFSLHMMERPSMDQVQFASNVYHFPPSPHSAEVQQTKRSAEGAFSPLVIFQLGVTIGLALLATFLQVEFYQAHDVLPGYAWPLAIAGALGMLSLASLKFVGVWTDRARKFLYGACYVFTVLSSSFHVADKAWDDAAKIPVTEHAGNKTDLSPSADRALDAMTDALKQATKNRAWNVMETMGVHVSKQIVPKASVQQPKPFGISRDWVIGVGAVIIIVLRALLEGIQALTAIAVRNYLAARYSR